MNTSRPTVLFGWNRRFGVNAPFPQGKSARLQSFASFRMKSPKSSAWLVMFSFWWMFFR